MKYVEASWTKLFVRIDQADLDKALKTYILKLYPKYKKGYRFSFPKLGPSDIVEANIEQED